ncbi:hypothetical protein J4219_04630 [Candidatus Woesearchaeota archaeon]|nr:hypothetical protein [Candidatus Woesearchaeota archaeon]
MITGAIVLPPSGDLTCSYVNASSCPVGMSKIFAISNGSNAHAQLFNETSYGHLLCCNDSSGANTIGTDANGTAFLHLSNFTNAHSELTSLSNYAINATISASNASMDCNVNLTGAGACPIDNACLVTLSNTTNAHVANCSSGSAYNITVCCSIGAFTSEYFHPDAAPADNLTASGSIDGSLVEGDTSYVTQSILYLNASNGKRFLIFDGFFNTNDVNANAMTLDFNESAVVFNLSGVTGRSVNHTLFIDASAVRNLGVRVCPSADILSQVNDTCTSGVDFVGALPQTSSGVTASVDGSDYRLDGVIGSGAMLITVFNSTLINTTVENSTIFNSTKINSTIINSTINNSFNINCTIINGVEINSSCSFSFVRDSNLSGSVVVNSTINDSVLVNSTKINSTVLNSTVINSVNNNCTVINSTENGLTCTNAFISNNFCFNGVLIFNGITFNCPIALSALVPPFAPGGGGGSGGGGQYAAMQIATSGPPITAITNPFITPFMSRLEVVRFMVDGVEHTLTVMNVLSARARVLVRSVPQEFSIDIGFGRSIDVTEDGVDDVVIELVDIQKAHAKFKITTIGKPRRESSVGQPVRVEERVAPQESEPASYAGGQADSGSLVGRALEPSYDGGVVSASFIAGVLVSVLVLALVGYLVLARRRSQAAVPAPERLMLPAPSELPQESSDFAVQGPVSREQSLPVETQERIVSPQSIEVDKYDLESELKKKDHFSMDGYVKRAAREVAVESDSLKFAKKNIARMNKRLNNDKLFNEIEKKTKKLEKELGNKKYKKRRV